MISTGSFVGKYQLLQQLNSTLRGERFLARSTTSFEDIVVIRLWYTDSHNTTLSHEMERIHAQLQHPLILPTIDFGAENGLFYIVTNYSTPVPETLCERLMKRQRPEPMPPTEALNILTQVGQALQFAHERKILHGQLTPDSIFLTPAGTALLSDLGVADLMDVTIPRDLPLSALAEQYAYTSPEQLRGEVSEASDQYALGSIAYELFTGLRYQPQTQLRAINPVLSPIIEEVIFKAIAPLAAKRYENINAFIDALTYAVTLPVDLPTEMMAAINNNGDTSPSFALIPCDQSLVFSTPDWPATSDQPWHPTQPGMTLPRLSGLLPRVLRASQEQSYIGGDTVPMLADSIRPKRKASPQDAHNTIRKKRTLTALILLIVLVPLFAFSVLSFVPASAATVKVTPISKHLTKIYTFNEMSGDSNTTQHQVPARALTYITPKQTKTVPVTGRNHQDAASAQGELVFSNVTRNQTINANQTFPTKGGVQITIDKSFTINVGETITVPAHAVKQGASGNIPVNAINGIYTLVDPANPTQTTTVSVENVKPFAGGQDAIDVTFVQQSDIDKIVDPLVTQLTSNAQTKLLSMVQPNQIPVGQVHCTPNTQTQPHVNVAAKSVKVSVEVICLLDTFIEQDIRDAAVAALKQDSKQELGINYVLQGNVVTDKPVLDSPLAAANGARRFHVKVDSTWVYQFTPAMQQKILQNIAGKNQFSAMDYLQHSAGVNQVTISTSGLGRALPLSIKTIQFMPVGSVSIK
ncbi:MAG: hypothetical protein E6J34_13360 [Chloroflexi bacterium]|nr:MAG: hypothetical protein E6J34_13360 [Chloroflexota bacterium]